MMIREEQEYATGGRAPAAGRVQMQIDRHVGHLQHRPVVRPQSIWIGLFQLALRRSDRLRDEIAYLVRGNVDGHVRMEAALYLQTYRAPASDVYQRQMIDQLLRQNFPVHNMPRFFGGDALDLGLASTHVVTTAGVNFIVDAFQNSVEVENLRYHGFGTGTNAEATGDTALQTEETTQYNPDNTRPTGTLTEGASANIFRTVATYSPDSGGTRAITEHGIFSQAATGGGTLLDRSVFSVVNLVAGSDSLQATYELTFSAGG